jgi:hypothetical protein
MNHYFDLYVKVHLQGILCKAYKELTFSFLRYSALSKRNKQYKLQICAVSPSYSQS